MGSKSIIADKFSSKLPQNSYIKNKGGGSVGTFNAGRERSISETVAHLEEKGMSEIDSEQFLEFSMQELESRKLLSKIQFPWLDPILFVRQDHNRISGEYLKELRLCMGLPINAMCYLIDLAADLLGEYERDQDIILTSGAKKRISEIGETFSRTGIRPSIIPSPDGRCRRDATYGKGYHQKRIAKRRRNAAKRDQEEKELRSIQAERILSDTTTKEQALLQAVPTEEDTARALKEKREAEERLKNRTERIVAEKRAELFDYSKLVHKKRPFSESPMMYVLVGAACTATAVILHFNFIVN